MPVGPTLGVAVAAPNELAAVAAEDLARSGGGAVDAAVAATLVAMVSEPGIASLGGGAFVTVQPRSGGAVAIDGNVEMPGRQAPPDAFGRGVRTVTMAYGGGVETVVGHGSVATPGALAGLAEAHARFGRVPWSAVVAPAADVARAGFPLGTASEYYLQHVHDSIYGWHPDSRAALRSAAGERVVLGDVVRLPRLADSLDLIALEGAATLYTGGLAEVVAADMAEHDGLLGADDLSQYAASSGPALPVRVRDWTWSVLPPPSIGGPVLAAMLLLAAERPSDLSPAERTAYLARVAHAVLRFRDRELDRAQDRVPPATALLDALRDDAPAWLATAALRSPSTVHISVVDSDGTACAVTSSSGYGSGVMTPGTGIWMNNCLGEPELNRRGLHAWTPGTRLPSNMAPTVGRRDDGAVLAAGSPGADRITTALLQVISEVADGAELTAAVDALRWHVRLDPAGADLLELEEGLDVAAVAGLPLRESRPTSMYFGGVAAALHRADGRLSAAADPRRTGAVRVVAPSA